MNDDIMWNVKYWSNELEKLNEKIHPVRSKLCEAPIPELTYEERFELREALLHYSSISHLLKQDLDRHDNTPPVPFYKKLFRKK